jgi:SAM-dependent methyltransferase/GT2 family glycosyltransferase
MKVAEIAPRSGYPDLGPDGWLACGACGHRYPIIAGTPRMLDAEAQLRLATEYPDAAIEITRPAIQDPSATSVRQRTAESFAYEWSHFGDLRPEWRKNFVDYLRPHTPESLGSLLVLDVGAGSGRHSAQAADHGARVVAVDLGQSIDVARRNLPEHALTVQADAERLPFAHGLFDIVMSIGVLHHLQDTERAIEGLVPYIAPGGHLHVYLYWVPEAAWHRRILRLVSAARKVTVRLPYRVLHELCYPLAALLWVGIVIPYRLLRSRPILARVAEAFPLKTYADYPFGVLVNDQFDRFSAPIERRFTRAQVQVMLERAGLEEVLTISNHGWIGDGIPRASAKRPDGITVVVPVLNDREGLRQLLVHLAHQTLAPDEVIIVDGGSTDGTLGVVNEFEFQTAAVSTIVAPGTNIAGARNVGVRSASYELVACTDAGCVPDPGWLAALRTGLGDADLVSGPVVIDARTPFEDILAVAHYPMPEELHETNIGTRLSHRLFGRRYSAERTPGGSMAFRRDVWRAVGGFPEHQHAGEDHAFGRTIRDNGFSVAFAENARVRWRPPATPMANAQMFYRYCRGDVRAKGRSRHVVRFLVWVTAPVAAAKSGPPVRLSVGAAALAYISLPLRRAAKAGIPRRSWWQIPLVVALKDLAQIAGAVTGVVDAIRGVPQPSPGARSLAGENEPSSASGPPPYETNNPACANR